MLEPGKLRRGLALASFVREEDENKAVSSWIGLSLFEEGQGKILACGLDLSPDSERTKRMFSILAGKRPATKIVACEPKAAPSLTEGEYKYDFGDTANLTPLLKMYSLGADFVPDPVHAGGLRYHGMSPLVSHCYAEGLIDAIAIKQREAFEAGVIFSRAEGIVPASESNHAIAGGIRQAREAAKTGDSPVIVIGVSGSGQLDLPAYAEYLTGDMPDS